ncbi:MAG: hypothetical protein QM756_46670 [Polyangiaceae bacterium]
MGSIELAARGPRQRRPSPKPPAWALFVLLLLAILPPFVAQAFGSSIGSYTMFNRLERYRLELRASMPAGDVDIPVRALAPHLSREAKIILMPAAGFGIGADQVDVVDEGLEDLARFVCDLQPRALSGRAALVREAMNGAGASRRREVSVACSVRRR